ncbi:hypothetical protein K9M48_01740 [Candidatus Gracilibacteria bacterium]|nr:hypothetical protein [Candidatus Gracilibacteria bacterium]
MKKVIILSLTLLAGLFVLSNTTKAATSLLDLEITAVTGSCIYGDNLDLGDHAQQYAAFNMTGNFLNTSAAGKRSCDDTAGKAPWTMDIESTDLVAGSYSIPVAAQKVLASAPTVYAGDATVFTGTASHQTYTSLTTSAVALISKTSAAGTVGELGVDTVTLAVEVPANQEIGAYKATITITVPTM